MCHYKETMSGEASENALSYLNVHKKEETFLKLLRWILLLKFRKNPFFFKLIAVLRGGKLLREMYQSGAAAMFFVHNIQHFMPVFFCQIATCIMQKRKIFLAPHRMELITDYFLISFQSILKRLVYMNAK